MEKNQPIFEPIGEPDESILKSFERIATHMVDNHEKVRSALVLLIMDENKSPKKPKDDPNKDFSSNLFYHTGLPEDIGASLGAALEKFPELITIFIVALAKGKNKAYFDFIWDKWQKFENATVTSSSVDPLIQGILDTFSPKDPEKE